jgi:hypothetical protein
VGNNFCVSREFERYVYVLIVDVAEIHKLARVGRMLTSKY